MRIDLNNEGTVNIYNCAAPGHEDRDHEHADREPGEPCPPGADGLCVPVAPGTKHKQDRTSKLERLHKNGGVSSVMAATVVHQARRYLANESPANDLETSVFSVFADMPSEMTELLECALSSFDTIPQDLRDGVFSRAILDLGTQPLELSFLGGQFLDEIADWASKAVFDDLRCVDEQAGLPRPTFSEINGGAFLGFVPRICRINDLRTALFRPRLAQGEYLPEEFQSSCTPNIVDGEVEVGCEFDEPPCVGLQIGTACAVVPDTTPGDSVLLEGLNFFDIGATVRLDALAPGTTSREVDAFVCGDLTTPATETIDGNDVPINDCRVSDRLSFQVPDDLPVGVYEVRVAVPNNTGIAGTDPEYVSDPIHINVLPPATAVFQITAETIHAQKETSPAWWGSDEVGLRFLAIPMFNDGSFGSTEESNFRFGNVDSGDTRPINDILVREANLVGVAMAIIGFEVDSEKAFEEQIDSFTDAFVDIVKVVWDELVEVVGPAAAFLIKKFGWKGGLVTAIAVAIAFAVIALVAWWAPADLIIEDVIALSNVDLAVLTSLNHPEPPSVTYNTTGEIEVTVTPDEKAQFYREQREYKSDEEDSNYNIFLRYDRF